jgi:SAM-dependent methyltransferase
MAVADREEPMDQVELARQKREAAANWAVRAPAWTELAPKVEKLARGLNEPLIAAAEIAPGQQVLDIASGAGEPAIPIARLVGATGRVTATDLTEGMLQGLEQRAKSLGVANMAFRQADMEALPYPDASFDRVTCRLGLMYTPRPEVALREVRRVLKPSGRAAWLVWGPTAENTQFTVLDRVLHDAFGVDAHEAGFTPTRFGLPGALTDLLRAAGFPRVEEREARFAPRIDPATGFWRPQLALRLGDKLAAMNEAGRTRLDRTMAEAFERYRDGDRIRLRALVRIGIGVA